MHTITLVPIETLKIHEAVDEAAVTRVVASIEETGKFHPPLLVDTVTHVILDGHHRYWACRRLGLKRVPCFCIDYMNDDSVMLKSWRPDVRVTKQQVLDMGMSEGIFPHKTTRHVCQIPELDAVDVSELR